MDLPKIIQVFIISRLAFRFTVCAVKRMQKTGRRAAHLLGEKEKPEVFMLVVFTSTMM